MAHLSTWIRASCLALAMGVMLAGCGGPSLTAGGKPGQAAPQTTQPASPFAGIEPTPSAPSSPKIPGASTTVGLLVPMSGPNAPLGRALSQAAEMALFDAGDDKTALVVRDTEAQGGAGGAAQAAVDQGANILLGPIFANQAKLVAPIAAAAHVPLVSFTTDKSVAAPGVYVMGILPNLQIDREVGYAASQGYKKFAALIPESPYGHAVADALGEAMARYNVSLAGIEYYSADATEFSGVVQKLSTSGAFDALVIPEGGFRLRAIVQLFSFYNIDTTKVKLLGSALWSDPSLAREPALAGAWFAEVPSDVWTTFDQHYKSVYGSSPPRRASLAYDAMTLASALAKNGDFSEAGLTLPSGYLGVDGAFRFQPGGLVERNLAVIEVQPSGLVVKDPAPKAFQPPAS